MADADKLVTTLIKTIASELNYEPCEVIVKETSSGGANYSTKLYAATITSPNKDDLKLFCKIAGFNEQMRQRALTRYYDTERIFYTDLVKQYEKIQDDCHLKLEDRLVFPKFYGYNPNYMEETVVLEDLRAKGYKSYDRFSSVTWQYAAKSVEELAKLHALSVAYGQRNPEAYKKLLKDLKFQIPAEMESFKELCKGWFEGALEVTKEEYKERFTKFMEKYGDMEETTQFYDPLRCPAITHGDFKITNLLHKDFEDGNMQIAILDYQTLRAGSMPTDLIYFIFTGTDRQFRRRHMASLVEHYYSSLCTALRLRGVDPSDVYPREDFDYEMKTVLPFGLTVAVYVLLVLMVKDEDAPKITETFEFSEFAMKPNQLYGDRLNEILEDYIEWGIL